MDHDKDPAVVPMRRRRDAMMLRERAVAIASTHVRWGDRMTRRGGIRNEQKAIQATRVTPPLSFPSEHATVTDFGTVYGKYKDEAPSCQALSQICANWPKRKLA